MAATSAKEPFVFPTRQLFVLAVCRICEPIAFMSIFPYVYFMIASFGITHDERKIAMYVGGVTSAFTLAEFIAGVFWGRVSDRIGRKPVLLIGLVGTALSMISFGFSTSFVAALAARAVGGLLNGNMGVLQTTVAELVKEKDHQPRAYSIMPFVWCLGSIIGPAMGGALAQPCDNYPDIFPRGTIFDRYPFLLPNLVCVAVLIAGIMAGLLFLEETHEEKCRERDRGREVGHWLLRKVSRTPDLPSHRPLLGSQYLNYNSISNIGPEDQTEPITNDFSPSKGDAFIHGFTPAVIANIVSYGILAYHTISFDQLMPIFLSSPVSHDIPDLPFRFAGGLALSTKVIGFMLAVQGIYSMLAQLWLFPAVVRYYGTLHSYRFVLGMFPFLYVMVPYLVLLPVKFQMGAAYAALIGKVTLNVIAYPANAILLTNVAPSYRLLGSINGVAASVASLSRTFGPTVTGFIHSRGLELGYSIFSWWACAIVCVLGFVQSYWIHEEDPHSDEDETQVIFGRSDSGIENGMPAKAKSNAKAGDVDVECGNQ